MTNKLRNLTKENADIDSPSAGLRLEWYLQKLEDCRLYLCQKTEDGMGGLSLNWRISSH